MTLRSNSHCNTQVKTRGWIESKGRKRMIQLVKHKKYKRVSIVYIPMYYEVVMRRTVTNMWSGNRVTQSGAELLWSRRGLITKVENNLGLSLCTVSQMVTYYLWWVLWYFKEFKNAKLDKWQKMLLSLRSNPQTINPYIQNCDGLCTRTDHHMLLPIVLHMVVPLYYE